MLVSLPEKKNYDKQPLLVIQARDEIKKESVNKDSKEKKTQKSNNNMYS